MAESEGFEPPEPCGSSDFKSGAFDHSANSPFTTYDTLTDRGCQPPYYFYFLARVIGVEPMASGFVDRRSIQLSYTRVEKFGWGGRIRTYE